MRSHHDSPLARWAFAAIGIVALTTGQYLAALVCAAVTAYAWKVKP